MQGRFTTANKDYEWWAGKASDEASSEYCVHCRNGAYGVTLYLDSKPDGSEAERVARSLAQDVDKLH